MKYVQNTLLAFLAKTSVELIVIDTICRLLPCPGQRKDESAGSSLPAAEAERTVRTN